VGCNASKRREEDIPTTINRFELLCNLTKNADDYRPEKDKDEELRNYS